ncbi:MAG: hypothetical protein EON59_16030, partial [Alphaproteobacteria bacterium]
MTDKIEELIERLHCILEHDGSPKDLTISQAADALAALRTQRNEVVEESAALAESQLYNPPADEYDESWNDACEFIATAIRNLKSEDQAGRLAAGI